MERETLHRLLRDMTLSRVFEERAAEEYTKGNIVGFLHLYPGEEAVRAGVFNAATPSDYIVSTYREHAHALVRGVRRGMSWPNCSGAQPECRAAWVVQCIW
jgi:pyruvate dehydrogenase E1 component alpha subunit